MFPLSNNNKGYNLGRHSLGLQQGRFLFWYTVPLFYFSGFSTLGDMQQLKEVVISLH